MPTNYTALTNGQFATAGTFNAPLTELDDAIEAYSSGVKTLAAPSITSFANALHTHQNAAGGGTLNASAIAAGTLTNIPVTGSTGSFTGLTVTATAPEAIITGTAGNNRVLRYRSGANERWAIYTNTTAESGSSAGSDLQIAGYTDGGSPTNFVTITRSTGRVLLSGELEIDGALNHDGSTVGFYGTAPAVKPTVTGSRGSNAALASLLTALAGLGLLTDSSS